jgi:hypothetical protein
MQIKEAMDSQGGIGHISGTAGSSAGGAIPKQPRTPALGTFGTGHRMAQSLLGGPNPLTNTLVSSLLGSGLGYGAGYLAEKLLPNRYFKPGRGRRTGATLGALAGGALPAWSGVAAVQNEGWRGLFNRNATPVYPWSSGKNAEASRFGDLVEELIDAFPLNDDYVAAGQKYASMHGRRGTGLFGIESVPVDAFNNVVWNDTMSPHAARYNPYGTRAVGSNNESRMHFNPTPAPVAAVATGLVSGIGSASNKSWLSPMDIAKGMVNAGIGAASAKALGGLAGAFFGLRPETRHQLENAGALGGLLTPIVGNMLR